MYAFVENMGVCAFCAIHCVVPYVLCFMCVVCLCVFADRKVCALFVTYCVMLYGERWCFVCVCVCDLFKRVCV